MESNYQKDEEQIQHFGHDKEHPLTLLEVSDESCRICSKKIRGPRYACAPCKFYLHKSCAELHPGIQHPFHPDHVLYSRYQEINGGKNIASMPVA